MPKQFAVSPSEEFTVGLKSEEDLPEAERSRFRVVTLTGAQRHEVNRILAAALGDGTGPAARPRVEAGAAWDALFRAAEHGLVGWENVTDQKGLPVRFPGRGRRALDLLPTTVVQEIGSAILERSNLTEADRKN